MMSRLQWKQKNRAEGSDEENDPYKKSNALLSDIIMNYRTVIAFGEKNVTYLMKGFGELLSEPNKEGIKKAHIAGFFFGYSQGIRFFFIGFIFYICSLLIYKNIENPKDAYIGVYVLFVAALGTGTTLSAAPSVGKAKEAARKIFEIIEERSVIDPRDAKGIKTIERGEIEFK